MTNWKKLNKVEYDIVWNKFNELFDFTPSTHKFPAIKTTMPSIKFDIVDCYNPNYSLSKLEDIAINLFIEITKPEERIYALDWHHDCYDFDPRQEMERDEFGEWLVPIFPNGDYYIFLTKDFKNIWFGHPWEETITLIGENIIDRQRLSNELKLKR